MPKGVNPDLLRFEFLETGESHVQGEGARQEFGEDNVATVVSFSGARPAAFPVCDLDVGTDHGGLAGVGDFAGDLTGQALSG